MSISPRAISSLQGELLQYLTAYLVPAGVALGPAIVWVLITYPALAHMLAIYPWLAFGAAVLLLTTVGVVLSELGGFLEIMWLDAARDQSSSERHSKEWKRYLTITLSPDHNGRRYMSILAALLRYELASIFAFPICGISFLLCFGLCGAPRWITVLILTATTLLTGLFVWAARTAHGSLSDLRTAILASQEPVGASVTSHAAAAPVPTFPPPTGTPQAGPGLS